MALVLIAAGATTFGLTSLANAQAEHDTGHQVSGSAASKNREDDRRLLTPYRRQAAEAVQAAKPGLDPATPAFQAAMQQELEPIVQFNRQLFKDLICLCGCPRESLYHCRCGNAANERGVILSMLAKHDLWTQEGRDAARADVVGQMMKRHADENGSGTHVLMVVPDEGFNRLAWAIPYVAFAGALAMLFGVSRRWVRTGKQQLAMNDVVVPAQDEDEDYSDILDDELRETD